MGKNGPVLKCAKDLYLPLILVRFVSAQHRRKSGCTFMGTRFAKVHSIGLMLFLMISGKGPTDINGSRVRLIFLRGKIFLYKWI